MVELLNYFGDDTMIANVARVSYAKEALGYTEEQNAKLIKFLYDHKHTSCFRHPQLQFRIKCPIYVERQLRKHELGVEIGPESNSSINSISGRYVDFSDSYYEIEQFRKQSENSKQGSGEDLNKEDNEEALRIQDFIILNAKESYKRMIELGVSKEQARSILPLSLETEFIWTGSLLAFFHMCNLRLKSDTQKETRDLVQKMLNQVQSIPGNPFKHTLEAMNFNN